MMVMFFPMLMIMPFLLISCFGFVFLSHNYEPIFFKLLSFFSFELSHLKRWFRRGIIVLGLFFFWSIFWLKCSVFTFFLLFTIFAFVVMPRFEFSSPLLIISFLIFSFSFVIVRFFPLFRFIFSFFFCFVCSLFVKILFWLIFFDFWSFRNFNFFLFNYFFLFLLDFFVLSRLLNLFFNFLLFDFNSVRFLLYFFLWNILLSPIFLFFISQHNISIFSKEFHICFLSLAILGNLQKMSCDLFNSLV